MIFCSCQRTGAQDTLFASMRTTYIPMHELHGQCSVGYVWQGKKGIRARLLVIVSFHFVRMAWRLSGRKEKTLAVRESPRIHCFILYSTTELPKFDNSEIRHRFERKVATRPCLLLLCSYQCCSVSVDVSVDVSAQLRPLPKETNEADYAHILLQLIVKCRITACVLRNFANPN